MEWLKTQFDRLLIQDVGSLLAVSLGWPAVILSMLRAISGAYFLKPRLLLVAAVLVLPISFYLPGANSWIAIIAPIIPVSFVICWYATKRKRLFIAWTTLILPLATFMCLAYWLAK